jgi:hypothetical protein
MAGAVTIHFSGHQIAVYGGTWFNHGQYSVALDGMLSQSYNGISQSFRGQQLLYFASGLSNGTHRVVLTNTQKGTDLDFDYAIATTYWAAAESSSSSTVPSSLPMPSSTNSAPTLDPSRSSSPVAAITGGVVGGFIMLSIIALLLYLVYRQWRKNHSLDENHAGSGTPAMSMTTSGMMRHPYAPGVQEPYYSTAASAGSSEAPLFSPRGGNETDMPPPNYDHVYSQAGSPVGGSLTGASSVGASQVGSSAPGGIMSAPPSSQNGQRGKREVIRQALLNRAASD